jgi:hypothetical protein
VAAKEAFAEAQAKEEMVQYPLGFLGDGTLTDLIAKAPVIFGGLGLATLGVKIDAAKAAGPVAAKAAKAK